MDRVRCNTCKHVNDAGAMTCLRCGSPLPLVNIQVKPDPSEAGGDAPRPGPDKMRPGQVVASRYVIQDIIGRGGMGRIYKVHDNTLNEIVALKTLLPEYVRDKIVVDRFFNEARIARALSHPNIVRVHDIGTADDLVYISMELLHGESLRQTIEGLLPGTRLPVKRILSIFDGLCAALEYAHDYTIHRDIKPENVMVLPDGTIKLMDFGISKLMANTQMTSPSMVMGTPHYMSPEQLRNSANVDARSDIYSVGVMLYELLTGNTPAGLLQPVSETSHQVPPSLDPIVETCLQQSPEKRYQSVTELRAALKEVRDIVEATEAPAEFKQPGAPGVVKSRSDAFKKAIGVALIATILVGAGFGLWRAEKVRTNATKSLAHHATSSRHAFDALYAEGQKLQVQARNRRKELAGSDIEEPVKEVLRKASNELQAAAMNAKTDFRKAIGQVLRASQEFAAVIIWPSDMLFVPASTPVADLLSTRASGEHLEAFFIDRYEVSTSEYRSFTQWPWPSEAPLDESSYPMTYVSYYDALAYASNQNPPKTLPTVAQWDHAVSVAKTRGLLMRADRSVPSPTNSDKTLSSTGELETDSEAADAENARYQKILFSYPDLRLWTQTVSYSYAEGLPKDSQGAPIPTFDTPMVTVGTWIDEFDELTASAPEDIRYESRFEDVGFRCVLALPGSLSGIGKMLESIK